MFVIIQIRGTSGSGKSTVVHSIMNEYGGTFFKRYIYGRQKPISYMHEDGRLVVLGHYESPYRGCDAIGSARQVYDLIQTIDAQVILCEGLLLSEDTKWSSQLEDLRVVFLTTPLERCLQQIESRRRAAGNDNPLNPKHTQNRVAVIERARRNLLELGIECRRCSSNQAPGIILDWIKRAS